MEIKDKVKVSVARCDQYHSIKINDEVFFVNSCDDLNENLVLALQMHFDFEYSSHCFDDDEVDAFDKWSQA